MKFCERQPETLPETLPAGTRTQNGSVAQSALVLERNTYDCHYRGTWDSVVHGPGFSGKASAVTIDWSLVPMPEEPTPQLPVGASAADECAACGAADHSRQWTWCNGNETADVMGAPLCAHCSGVRPWAETRDAIRARRALLAAPTVAELQRPTAEGEIRMANGSFIGGKWVPDSKARHDPGDHRAECYCKECGVTVVAGPDVELPLCGGCVERRGPQMVIGIDWAQGALCSTPACAARGVIARERGRCVHCDFRLSTGFSDEAIAARTSKKPGQAEASVRLAARDRAERPRQTATSREMLKPHPWELDE